jgi:oxalate---CoA ligase
MTHSDRVFVHAANTPEFFVDLLAIWRLGGCVIPIDPWLTAFEVENLARFAAPRFLVWPTISDNHPGERFSELGVQTLTASDDIGDIEECSPGLVSGLRLDQDALILFTSGTTGQPKGVVHTHRSLRAQWMSLKQCLGLQTFRRTLCLLPTHFGHGLICNSLFPWVFGQDLYLVPPFRADLLAQLGVLLDEERITFMSSVPAMWRLVLKTAKPPQARTLERVFCGSAPLSSTLWKAIQEWTNAREVLNVYGITEVASWLAGTTVPGFTAADGLIGVPWGAVIKVLRGKETSTPLQPNQECVAGESGYVWVSTPALMKGYLGRNDLTDQVVSNGWFYSGDIGILDQRGLFYLKGREREEINKGGIKVSPTDIDAVVQRFDQTIDVCAFGYEDAMHGENVGIAVVLQSADRDALHRLYGWVSQHLAKYQMPQRWYVLDAIPRTSRGKANRAAVAAHCAKRTAVDLRSVSEPNPETTRESR